MEEYNIIIPNVAVNVLLFRCLLNIQLLFDGVLCNKLDGVAIGSPICSLPSNNYMAKLENISLQPTIDKLTGYYRYVDDIFCVLMIT